MSTTVAGNPALFPASITIPSDGDLKSAASVNAAFGGLADRTAHLARPEQDVTKKYPLAARTIGPRTQKGLFFFFTGSTVWTKITGGGGGVQTVGIQQILADSTEYAQCMLDLPHGALLSAVTVYVVGATVTTMPAQKARYDLWKTNPSTFAVTQIGTTVTDGQTTVGGYTVLHAETVNAAGELIDNDTYQYSFTVRGSSGGGAVAGLVVHSVKATYVVSAQDDGAA